MLIFVNLSCKNWLFSLKTGVITCYMHVVKEFFLAIMSLLIVIVVIKSEFWRISCPHNFYLDFKATHEFYTSEIKVDVNLDFKEHFWRILKTTLISRQLMNFTSKIKVDFNLQRTVLANFENNLDFTATHEFYLDFKSTLI